MTSEKKHLKGLTDEQVKQSLEKHGNNKITEKAPPTFLEKFKESFDEPMIKLLLAISVIMGINMIINHGEIGEVIGILISVLLVTFISTKTEMASDKSYRKLKAEQKKETCRVLRNGQIVELDIDDIVVGDIILLQSGDSIPADGMLIEGNLKVNNSSLNGETEECKKIAVGENSNYVFPEQITGDSFVDSHSLFRGATIFNGEGKMQVTKVGMATMMGKMAEDMAQDEVDGPLKVKLTHLAGLISKFGYIGAIAISLIYLIREITTVGGFTPFFAQGFSTVLDSVLSIVMVGVTIVVMAVPEGLPLMIAIVLMQNTKKMADKQVLVRKPIGIETAGSLNILFSDKTGTITKGKLEVVEFFDGMVDTYTFDNIPDKTKGCLELSIGKNTSANFDSKHKVVGGNATDKALLEFLTEDIFNTLQNDSECDITEKQTFNSANKFSQAYIPKAQKTFYKGAPERLLAKAKKCLDKDGNVVDLDLSKVNAKIDGLANKAMRVLAFGYSDSPLVEDNINDDVVIIGFVGIRDEVREEAKQAIEEVQNAGIQVVMITGDRKETAVAIAKDAGLLKKETDIALTSMELNTMTDDEIKKILPNIRVIARALPTDKSRMVRISQEMNLVCGMTGDGVNDSPALKRADVGFAMGSGTDVAKEAGKIIITDDNFLSIRNAILYGRTIYNNIMKFICFQLTINVAAVAVSVIAPLLGIDEPLKITHMLWINLVMDGLGALALGGEPALEKYMKEKPKERTQPLINKTIASQVLIAGTWFTGLSLVFLNHPFFLKFFGSIEQLKTAYFCLFVFTAVLNGFNVRSTSVNVLERIEDNKNFLKVLGIILLVQVGITYIGGTMFSCTPFAFKGWLLIFALAFTIIPVDMLRKIITKSK